MYASTLPKMYQGEPFVFDIKQIMLHIAYLIPFSEKNWISGVYWTLCVEFQFYVLIAIAYPAIRVSPRLTIALLILSPFLIVRNFLPDEQLPLGGGRELIVIHLPIFMMGTLLYFREANVIDAISFAVLMACPIEVVQPEC